jgi:hypothetical protein
MTAVIKTRGARRRKDFIVKWRKREEVTPVDF